MCAELFVYSLLVVFGMREFAAFLKLRKGTIEVFWRDKFLVCILSKYGWE